MVSLSVDWHFVKLSFIVCMCVHAHVRACVPVHVCVYVRAHAGTLSIFVISSMTIYGGLGLSNFVI